MPDERVTKVSVSTYEIIKAKAQSEGISMAQALDRLVKEAPAPTLTPCVEKAARLSLERQGIKPPARLDWAYRMVSVLGGLAEVSPKLAPYYRAFKEAEEEICPFIAEAEGLAEREEGKVEEE